MKFLKGLDGIGKPGPVSLQVHGFEQTGTICSQTGHGQPVVEGCYRRFAFVRGQSGGNQIDLFKRQVLTDFFR